MDQIELYESQAGNGRSICVNRDAALIGRDQFVINYLADCCADSSEPLQVAELSIGEGRLTLSLLRRFPGMRLHGFDISVSRLEYVQRSIGELADTEARGVQLTVCNFDTQFSEIDSGAYQAVIALDIMEHVLDVFGFVEHCRRILRRGGFLFLRVPNIAYIRHRLGLLAGGLPVTASWFGPPDDFTAWREIHGWDGGHLHLFTVPVLYQLLEGLGFAVELCRDPGTRFERLRNMAPNLFYANPLLVARAR